MQPAAKSLTVKRIGNAGRIQICKSLNGFLR
jgi:hypothetical protein